MSLTINPPPPDRGIYPLGELARRSAEIFGPKPAMRVWSGGEYVELTYRELASDVCAVANYLIESGLSPGDHAAVLSENRPGWGVCYLAILAAGAVVIPVDSLMPERGVRHVLEDSASRVIFCSVKFLEMLAGSGADRSIEKIVCFDDNANPRSVLLSDVVAAGRKLRHALPSRGLDDLAAILYTSGTTGHSKGVMLSHGNIMSNVAACSRIFPVGTADTFLSVLPLHHALECTAGFLLPLYCGSSITYARSLKSADLIADMRLTAVTLMVGVPLLYEKMHGSILRGVLKKGARLSAVFKMLHFLVASLDLAGLHIGEFVFGGMMRRAGLGTVKFFVSGGGALNPKIARFFNRLGIKLMQGYGLTETSPVTHVNPPWKVRHHTVGPPIPGVECRLWDANSLKVGEICIRGPNVFLGYYRNKQATREAFTDDGWFRTGDLGIIEKGGYLKIVGRKKNLIVTGGGKNIYPEEIETHLNSSPYIAESLVVPVKRESGYGEEPSALIYPSEEAVEEYFLSQNIARTEARVRELIKRELQSVQQALASYKRVVRFNIVDREFEKTSTRKIKRYLYTNAQK